jgi:hypothetical protein
MAETSKGFAIFPWVTRLVELVGVRNSGYLRTSNQNEGLESEENILQKKKNDLAVAFRETDFSFPEEGGIMSDRHNDQRLFSKKTRERLEVYLVILKIFLLILTVLNLIFRA